MAEKTNVDPLWYKDAIIYQLHVKTFFDANGDGYGDFRGLIEKLDYVKELGVDCIWILPFYPSPLKDDGFDVADYFSVNPIYGNLADAEEFLVEAKKRGLKVLTELVVNHTSDQHPWFQSARSAPKGSEERDFYVWSDSEDLYKDARIIFTDTEKSNWTYDEKAGQYFWHRFFSHQPDLNYDNPKVIEAVKEVMDFWLERGVDSLRLDAIPYLIERDGTNCENLPETHSVLKKFRAHLDEKFKGRFLLAEANQWPHDVIEYFGDGDECHVAYHFPVMPRLYMAIHKEDCTPIIEIMKKTPDIPADCQWAMFLRNHDELTLEMVSEEERDYMYKAYAPDPRMKCNVGIRRRLAPLLDNNMDKIKLLNGILFSLTGTPIIYYGDEIGMGENIQLKDRDGVRTPMQWNANRNAGFSEAEPEKLYYQPIRSTVFDYKAVNVEAQKADKSSLLNWMKKTIQVRKSTSVFGRGDLKFLESNNKACLAYLRSYEGKNIFCAFNFSGSSQYAHFDLSEFKGKTPECMYSNVPLNKIGDKDYELTFAPYTFYWLSL